MVEDFRRDPYYFFCKHIEQSVEDKTTDAMAFGTAVHELALLGRYDSVRPIPDEIANLSGTGSRTAKDNWQRENPADVYLKPSDGEQVERCIAAIKSHDAANRLIFGEGESEVPVYGVCPCTGLTIRAKFDRLIESDDAVVIADIKTTTDVSPQKFAYKIRDYGYDRQAAWYSRIAEQLTGKRAVWYFVAVETSQVPRVEVYQLDDIDIEDADRDLFDPGGLMDRLAAAKSSGVWRAEDYGRPKSLELPRRNVSYEV